MKQGKKSWQRVSQKVVHENPYYNVVQEGFILPNGREGKYYVQNSNHGTNKGVYIVALKEGRIYFIRQYRYTIKKMILELPGGGVPPGKQVLTMAKNELREEVGYRAHKWTKLGSFYPMSGFCPELSTVYLAKDLQECDRALEDSEQGATVESYTIAQAYQMLDNGEIQDGPTMSVLAMARKKLQV